MRGFAESLSTRIMMEHVAFKGDDMREDKRCVKCIAFYRESPSGLFADGDCFGECRRRSPEKHGWPVVHESNWCLEFEEEI